MTPVLTSPGRRSPATVLKTEVWSSLSDAAPHVRALLASDPENPFLNPDWLDQHWQATRRSNEQSAVIAVYESIDGQPMLVAAAAFRYRRGLEFTTFRFLGECRSDYNSIAGRQSPDVLAAILDALRRLAPSSAVRFADVISGTPLAVFLALQPEVVVIRTSRCGGGVPGRTGVPGSSSPASAVPGSINRLNVLGPIRFDALDFDEDRKRYLTQLPELFALGAMVQPSHLWNELDRSFLCTFLSTAAQTNMLGFVTRLDGVAIAFELGFRIGNRFVSYAHAAHPSLAKFGPDRMNRYLCMRHCAALGIDRCDFGRDDGCGADDRTPAPRYYFEFCLPLHRDWRSRFASLWLSVPGRLRRHQWCRQTLLPWRVAPTHRSALEPPREVRGEHLRLTEWTGPQPLRYSLIADLPQPHLTRLINQLFERQPAHGLIARWIGPGALRIYVPGTQQAWTCR
jgi:hypothetical protein